MKELGTGFLYASSRLFREPIAACKEAPRCVPITVNGSVLSSHCLSSSAERPRRRPDKGNSPGAMVTFTWSNGGLPVAEWWLSVGTSAGANDLFDSGSLGSALSMTIDGFPTDGETIFVRLWYMLDGIWQYSDSQYTAAPTP